VVQARKVRGHVYVFKCIEFAFVSTIFDWNVELLRQCEMFASVSTIFPTSMKGGAIKQRLALARFLLHENHAF
jgi:hypothetical protein